VEPERTMGRGDVASFADELWGAHFLVDNPWTGFGRASSVLPVLLVFQRSVSSRNDTSSQHDGMIGPTVVPKVPVFPI
jgi:hypothetical protein